MKKLINISKTNQDKLVFFTKYILIITSLLMALPLLNKWMYNMNKIICVWALILVMILFVNDRKSFKTKEYVVLFFFCLSYLISIFLNRGEHFLNEIVILGYTIMSFFLLTYFSKDKKKDEAVKELVCFAKTIVFITLVFALINVFIYVTQIGEIVDYSKYKYIYGVVNGQLGGIYNPNTTATLNYISGIISLILFNTVKKNKKIHVFNIIVQGLCFSLVQSRGAWICLLTYILIYFLVIRMSKEKLKAKKIFLNFVSAILVCVVLCVASRTIRHGLFQVITANPNEVVEETNNQQDRVKSKESNFNSVSTGRAALWEAVIPAYKESPVLGIGFRSIDDVLKENLTKHQYIHSAKGGLHNIYITVLVSSGAVGLTLFLIFLVFIAVKIINILFSKECQDYIKLICVFIPVWLIGELVESRIILGINFLTIMFWTLIGYVCLFAKEIKKID